MDVLLTEIEARADEIAALTADLIRIPTLNPPGRNYRAICDAVAGRMRARGWQVEMIRAEEALGDSDAYPRWNVICRLEGARSGETVHFNSHHDVVAVGDGWTRDPFGGEIAEGRVWGRGACDMKGGLATSIVAAEAFADLCPGFAGAIEISATADEESGGYGGVAHLAELGRFDHVGHVIIPEPLGKDRICLGHRGVWWAEIETKGRIAHGSMPFLGDCAVRHMGAVIDEMERTLLPLLAGRRTDAPVIPDGARQPTVNLNSIHGGEPIQPEGYTGLPSACVPDRCVLTIDRRFLPEEDIAEVKAEVRAMMERVRAARPEFRYEIRDLFEVLPTMTPEDAPIVETVRRAIADVMGRDAGFVVSPGTYDQKHIDRIGRLKNCIAYGPGVLDLAHQPDEWIGIDDMVDSGKVMALALHRLLGRVKTIHLDINDRGSRYAVTGAVVTDAEAAKAVVKQLCREKKFAKATHNTWALISAGGPVKNDDGEAGAGMVILRMLEREGLENHVVIVTRWYGGKHLGGDRFRHVQTAVRTYLDTL